jgi:hypothetical protein
VLTTAVTVTNNPVTSTSSPSTNALNANNNGLIWLNSGASPSFWIASRIVLAISWTMARTFSVMHWASQVSAGGSAGASWRAEMRERRCLMEDVADCRAVVMAANLGLMAAAMVGMSRREGLGDAARVASGGC